MNVCCRISCPLIAKRRLMTLISIVQDTCDTSDFPKGRKVGMKYFLDHVDRIIDDVSCYIPHMYASL